MKRSKLLSSGVALLLLLGGGGGAWLLWSHSPTYALRQIVLAVQERDRYRFDRYVDVEGVISSFVADYAADNPLALAVANTLTTSMKQQVTKAIEDGSTTSDSQFGKGVSSLTSGTLDLHLERQGTNAYFAVPIKTNGGAPFNLRFHMTQVPDGYWRVDRATNVKDLLSVQAREEAARKAALAKEIEEQLAQLAVLAKLHTSINPDGWSPKNRFQVRFQNNSAHALSGMTGRIKSGAAGFDEAISGEDLGLAPGKAGNVVWEFRVNQFIAPTTKMYAMQDTDRFEVEVDSLTFADGSSVKHTDSE
jgi:hypothetical protein